MTVTDQALLADYTTLRLGGPAGRFVTADSAQQVVAAVRAADAEGEPVLVLGGGSNLVVADEGFGGTVVRIATSGARVIHADRDSVAVSVAAGENWARLVDWAVAEPWWAWPRHRPAWPSLRLTWCES